MNFPKKIHLCENKALVMAAVCRKIKKCLPVSKSVDDEITDICVFYGARLMMTMLRSETNQDIRARELTIISNRRIEKYKHSKYIS